MLALQAVEDPLARRRTALRRGRRLLDLLDGLKVAMLDGAVSAADIGHLAALLHDSREGVDDPGLESVLAEIDVRAAVELAKLDRARNLTLRKPRTARQFVVRMTFFAVVPAAMSDYRPRLEVQWRVGEMMSMSLDADYRPSDDEPFMNERQRDYFRRKLLSWKPDILREAQDTIANLQAENENHPDLADLASSETDQAIELRARDRHAQADLQDRCGADADRGWVLRLLRGDGRAHLAPPPRCPPDRDVVAGGARAARAPRARLPRRLREKPGFEPGFSWGAWRPSLGGAICRVRRA